MAQGKIGFTLLVSDQKKLEDIENLYCSKFCLKSKK